MRMNYGHPNMEQATIITYGCLTLVSTYSRYEKKLSRTQYLTVMQFYPHARKMQEW